MAELITVFCNKMIHCLMISCFFSEPQIQQSFWKLKSYELRQTSEKLNSALQSADWRIQYLTNHQVPHLIKSSSKIKKILGLNCVPYDCGGICNTQEINNKIDTGRIQESLKFGFSPCSLAPHPVQTLILTLGRRKMYAPSPTCKAPSVIY